MKAKFYFILAKVLRNIAYYLELASIKLRYLSNISNIYGIDSTNCSVEGKKEMYNILFRK